MAVNNRMYIKQSLLALLLAGVLGNAQSETVQNVVSKTVLSNPEVLAKWHQFKASGHERNITWGRYLPTLDVIFGRGHESRESPLFTTAPTGERTYNFDTSKITLRQNLYEGMATKNDTLRLEHAAMVRFYEMLDISETAAFEAAKAYADVWRFRQLVSYAEESYATHRVLYEKIKARAQSGAGRKVDLESAAGRLALSESNLLTETSNLHDVTARYQRIVGTLPAAELEPLPGSLLGKAMPGDRSTSINLSFEKSPALKAAVENILSATRNVDVQRAAYQPRVDAYVEKVHDSDVGGYAGPTKATTLGLTATWNLFNGERDQARDRKASEEKNNAKDLREKVCRDVRQNAAMAYNEYLRLTEQLQYLDQHQLSTDKAREAFRRQFDIGQRTLLDVLDTENEYYTARRNYLNAETDLEIAKAKYLASAGSLLKVLNLQHLDMEAFTPNTDVDSDTSICPPEAPLPYMRAKPADRFTLLPEAGGKIGEVFISREGGGELLLSTPYSAGNVDDRSITARQSSAEEVKERYRPLMLDAQVYTVRFAINKATMLPDSRKTFNTVVADYRKNPAHQIITIGHADKIGNEKRNLELSKLRAIAVRDMLISSGIPAASIEASWLGDRQPLPETGNKDERNRRVEIRLQ